MSIKGTNLWRFFSSIKLAIWLMGIIAFLSLIGTFIPQNETPEFYIDKFGHVGYSALLKTNLTNIYSSWWFILFLILFALNLTICLLNRAPFKKHSLGTVVSHLGILVVFIGALIGMIYGQKGPIRIREGEEANFFVSKYKKINLPFSIRLDDFIYTEYVDPKEKLLIYADKDQKLTAQIPVEIGKESNIALLGGKIKMLRYLPDFIIDISTKSATTRSAVPNNPAIEVELTDERGNVKRFWVFARFPDVHERLDADFKFIYDWAPRRPKDFISKVTILKDGKEMTKKDIRVNDPLSFGGYKFFQSSYDTESLAWSGLQIVKDPGVGVVYAGFILLIAGFIVIFYVNPVIRRR